MPLASLLVSLLSKRAVQTLFVLLKGCSLISGKEIPRCEMPSIKFFPKKTFELKEPWISRTKNYGGRTLIGNLHPRNEQIYDHPPRGQSGER